VIEMATAQLAAPDVAECVRVFPGEAGQVTAARIFVARVLADGAICGGPARETLLTCVTELAANAVKHTASGRGGVFTVSVGRPRDGVAFVAVTDEGGAGEPSVRDPGDLAEGGRGLALVHACSSRWGFRETPTGRTVWAEVTWPVRVPHQRRGEVADDTGGAAGSPWQNVHANATGPQGVA
jgi:anti-sigma regulatory factor (Ser/Thr protein kinase)